MILTILGKSPYDFDYFGEVALWFWFVKFSVVCDSVLGASNLDDGVLGASNLGDGVSGASNLGDGVLGASNLGYGFSGASNLGDGILGASNLGDGEIGLTLAAEDDHFGRVAGPNDRLPTYP